MKKVREIEGVVLQMSASSAVTCADFPAPGAQDGDSDTDTGSDGPGV